MVRDAAYAVKRCSRSIGVVALPDLEGIIGRQCDDMRKGVDWRARLIKQRAQQGL